MPDFEGNPLPREGLLYVFHRDQCAEFERSFEARWFPGPTSALRRAAPWMDFDRIGAHLAP